MAKLELTDQEWIDCLTVAEGISDDSLGEELEKLAEREKELLSAYKDGDDMREITLFNMSILAAAAGRLRKKG